MEDMEDMAAVHSMLNMAMVVRQRQTTALTVAMVEAVLTTMAKRTDSRPFLRHRHTGVVVTVDMADTVEMVVLLQAATVVATAAMAEGNKEDTEGEHRMERRLPRRPISPLLCTVSRLRLKGNTEHHRHLEVTVVEAVQPLDRWASVTGMIWPRVEVEDMVAVAEAVVVVAATDGIETLLYICCTSKQQC
jgi:hypothetical protein